MSFGLPLRDRILKWQLVSRVDSVSPVRGKKQQNQRTNISNTFECSDERVRVALPERRVSSSGSQRQLCLGPAVRGNQPYLSAGLSWAPTRCMEYDRVFMQRRFHSSLFLPNLFLLETETDDDFVFYLDKENKIWNGILRKKIYVFSCW